MIYLVALAIAGLVVVTVFAFKTIEANTLIAAQERENLNMAHAAQLAEFANRIQQPERASHISISESAAPAEPYVDPDIAEEMELLGV